MAVNWPSGAARADTIYSGQVGGARIAGGDVAYVLGANVVVASHGADGWHQTTLGFPSPLELDGFVEAEIRQREERLPQLFLPRA